jgi:hypothetical protein
MMEWHNHTHTTSFLVKSLWILYFPVYGLSKMNQLRSLSQFLPHSPISLSTRNSGLDCRIGHSKEKYESSQNFLQKMAGLLPWTEAMKGRPTP